MMTRSKELSMALGQSALYISSLVEHLKTSTEAGVQRSLLRMLQLMHQNHSNPRQYVLDNQLYELASDFSKSEKVIVRQIANELLAEFQNSTMS